MFTEIINCHVKEESEKQSVFQQGGVYLATKKIGKTKNFLQEMIFKFKLPPKPVPKIDLQEWNDMWILMEKLKKQAQEMRQTQREIALLKKQLSETKGFFKGKERGGTGSRI